MTPPLTERITPTLTRVAIPIPFPMKYVYCYLFQDDEEVTLVDAGFHYQPAQEAWQHLFMQLNIQPQQVSRIILTHFHPDHSSLAGWLQELTGATVLISAPDYEMMHKLWGPENFMAEKLSALFSEHGVPNSLVQQILESMAKIKERVTPFPQLTILEQSQIVLGGETWEVIPTPGHSVGHLCFYQRERQWLITADHILDRITPNISYWPEVTPNPLKQYLDSLKKIKSLPVTKGLTAHGKVLEQVHARVDELLQHHDQRIQKVRHLIGDQANAYQVASKLFDHLNLTPHQWRFALAESLSHLEYLRLAGELDWETDQHGIIYYSPSCSAGRTI